MKIIIKADGPILSGSVSTAESRCGKAECACRAKNPKLHGIYYRWTGFIGGKRTTKTISQEMATECQRRIDRYKAFKQRIDLALEEALQNAPWESQRSNKPREQKN